MTARKKSPTTFAATAQRLADNGYRPTPVDGKAAFLDDWPARQFHGEDVRQYADSSTGIVCGEIVGVDIDVRNAELVEQLEALADKHLGVAPRRIGAAPKVLRLYRADKPFRKVVSRKWALPGDEPGAPPHKIEILADGQQFVAFGIHPSTHRPYKWNGAGDPLSVPASELRVITEAQVRSFVEAANNMLAKAGQPYGAHSEPSDKRSPKMPSQLTMPLPDALSALAAIPNGVDYDQWIKIGLAFHQACGKHADSSAARDAWIAWSLKWPDNSRAIAIKKWKSFNSSSSRPNSERAGGGTLVMFANEAGWKRGSGVEVDAEQFDYTAHMRPVQELLDHPPPPIEFVLPGLLAKGACSLLIGKPKSFKSTLAAQMAIALTGNEWLLNMWAEFGDIRRAYRVAIIDYEQSEQIAAQLVARFGAKTVKGFHRLDKFPKLDEAGVAVLRRLIVEQRMDLVIVDSLTRAAPAPSKGSGVFAHEGEYVQRLTNLAHETGCHILIIAHGGKRDAADDPAQMIAGTNALPASVDDVMVLFKDGEDDERSVRRKLFVSGRNIAKHGTYVLEMAAGESFFVLRGSEEVFINGETRRLIVRALTGGVPLSPKEIADVVDRDKSQVHRALQKLLHEKLIVWLPTGKYTTRSAAAVRQVREKQQ